MKRSASASRALSLLSLVFVASTMLTLYMLSIQENLQYSQEQEALHRTHKVYPVQYSTLVHERTSTVLHPSDENRAIQDRTPALEEQYSDDNRVIQDSTFVEVQKTYHSAILTGVTSQSKMDARGSLEQRLPVQEDAHTMQNTVSERTKDKQMYNEEHVLQPPDTMTPTQRKSHMLHKLYTEERPFDDALHNSNIDNMLHQKHITELNRIRDKHNDSKISNRPLLPGRSQRKITSNMHRMQLNRKLHRTSDAIRFNHKFSMNTSHQTIDVFHPVQSRQLHNRKILETKLSPPTNDTKTHSIYLRDFSSFKSNNADPTGPKLRSNDNSLSDGIDLNIYEDPNSDRILEQIKLSEHMGKSNHQRRLKTIVLKSTFDDVLSGQHVFNQCPVSECKLTRTSEQLDMVTADAILFGHTLSDPYPYHLRSPKQIWVYFNLESSINTKLKMNFSDPYAINWTASYRSDSTLVTPYEKFVLFENATSPSPSPLLHTSSQESSSTSPSLTSIPSPSSPTESLSSPTPSPISPTSSIVSPTNSLLSPTISSIRPKASLTSSTSSVLSPTLRPTSPEPSTQAKTPTSSKDFAAGKTNKVAWFVSNCDDGNWRRSYARLLSEHISVHVYGACGQRKCPRTTEKYCFDKLQREYKFYLAFENSNCRDYITEKFFRNALMHGVIPIVMGAPKEDYAKVAPPHSFIHVDDFRSPRHLAEYLHVLDRDPAQYSAYFAWRAQGAFIDTQFFCRLCALLHRSAETGHEMWQERMEEWWNEGQCIEPLQWVSWLHGHRTV